LSLPQSWATSKLRHAKTEEAAASRNLETLYEEVDTDADQVRLAKSS